MTGIGSEGNRYRQKSNGEVAHALRNHKRDALYTEDQECWHNKGWLIAEANKGDAKEYMLMSQIYVLCH